MWVAGETRGLPRAEDGARGTRPRDGRKEAGRFADGGDDAAVDEVGRNERAAARMTISAMLPYLLAPHLHHEHTLGLLDQQRLAGDVSLIARCEPDRPRTVTTVGWRESKRRESG